MKNKGFTLVEILAVIVILSLLMVIAVPAAQGIGNRIKDKMLQTKLEVGVKSAVLWAQDNLSCFVAPVCNTVTPVNCPGDSNPNFICFTITFEKVAEAGFMEFDVISGSTKKIENPKHPNETLNNRRVLIKYHKINKNVTGLLYLI